MTQPAGWYADPSGLPARRWWDGKQWTDHIQPGGAPIPPPNGYFPPVPPTGPPLTTPAPVPQPVAAQRNGPSVPAPAPATYTMPPVDADPIPPPVAESVDTGLTRRQRTAGFAGLAVIAVLVLLLTAVILLA